jgi:tRNA-2-methylthio-N6-dimethylallyladenosine synthase
MDLVAAVSYAQAFSFKYSPRPGTPAATHETQIDEDTKSRRLAQLQARLNAQQEAFNREKLDTVLPVLFEKPSRQADQMSGRSPYLQPVHVGVAEQHFDALVGRILPVRITGAHANSLSGELADG